MQFCDDIISDRLTIGDEAGFDEIRLAVTGAASTDLLVEAKQIRAKDMATVKNLILVIKRRNSVI